MRAVVMPVIYHAASKKIQPSISMDGYPMVQADPHYNHPGQRPPPNWPPHMMSAHAHSGQASPGVADHGQHYPFYAQGPGSGQSQNPANPNQTGNGGSGDHGHGHGGMSRTASSLSLNLSSLTVTSPANLSPINPPQSSHGHTSAALSPVTPLSPPNNNPYHHAHHSITSQFQFNVPENTLPPVQQQSQGTPGQVPGSSHGHLGSGNSTPYDESTPQLPFDRRMSSTPTTGSRSSSASTSHSTSTSLSNLNGGGVLLRKRSFSSNGASTDTLVEVDEAYDESMDTTTPGSTAYDDGMDMRYTPGPGSGTGNVSPVDGSGSGGEDGLMGSGSGNGAGDGMGTAASNRPRNGEGGGLSIGLGSVGSMNILGKPMATNNFVTKLYQMISDPKSAHFIAWTEHGTSFVVSNVGEFSRSILGSHFKHNNFSSFVRQLNMYGFHKINRTPRAQRTSTDSQTWEFSHLKFLRGRPDLLDEIKRKALEPDPAVKHRVELPGEVAAQLGAMRDENRRVWEQVNIERRRADKLVNVVAQLWDVVGKGFPGGLPPFPNDLLDSSDNPNIFVTSAQGASRYPPPLSMNMGNPPMHSMHHTMTSPNPSPTNSEFPASHVHPSQHPQPLSRQHSFQHISYSRGDGANPSPMPSSSPGSISMDLYDNSDAGDVGRISTKRQRMAADDSGLLASNGSDPLSNLSSPNGSTAAVKKFSRARSDSAPLGYGLTSWQGTTRPRSGSNLSGQRGVPNIGNSTRGNITPLLSMANPNPSR
ncbi:HSF family protein [Pleurotus pulmonarius]